MGFIEGKMQIGQPACLKLPPPEPPPTLAERVQNLHERIERLEATAEYHRTQPDIRRGKVGPLGTLTFGPSPHEKPEWKTRIELAKAKIELGALEAELQKG